MGIRISIPVDPIEALSLIKGIAEREQQVDAPSAKFGEVQFPKGVKV